MLDCLKLLEELKGFGILAHVDGGAGFEKVMTGGASPHRLNIICHKALLGIELLSVASDIAYSDIDPDKVRASLGAERIARLGLGSRQYLARLLNSDAHTLKALGRNAAGDKKVSRIKMDKPSFDALRIALQDSDARVRIEEQIPESVPRVLGLAIDGGFLDGLQVHFSPNLNCIIGGRGTGKSTTFEAIRCLIAGAEPNDVVDSDVWPDQLRLFWQDQAGVHHTLDRSLGEDLQNADDPARGPTSFVIESYGQGETAQISKEAHTNPIALLSYLDRFVDVSGLEVEEDEAREICLALQTKIEEARRNVEKIPIWERDLATTQKQLAALEQANAKEVIALQRSLEGERAIRAEIMERISNVGEHVAELDLVQDVGELSSLADAGSLAVGRIEFAAILTSAESFAKSAQAAKEGAVGGFKAFEKAADTQIAAWKAKEAAALQGIDKKKKELEGQNIKLDMGYIQKLARDEARLSTELKGLKAWPTKLTALERQATKASTQRWTARDRIAAARMGYGKQASETLKAVLTDLTVSLKFLPSAYSPDAEEQIVSAMEWRTTQVPRSALMIEQLTMRGLLNAIDANDSGRLLTVKTPEDTQVFDRKEAKRIVERLGEPAVRFALERARVHDIPKLTVTGTSTRGGKTQYVTKDFAKLSLGQQQSVLLALMLSSKSNAPLIIDQPEDNLDSEFVYRTLVPVLRMAKERRQVIVVTHNANVAVLGDAELITVLKSTNDKSSVACSGSIDDAR